MSIQDQRTLELVRAAKEGDSRAMETLLQELEPDMKKLSSGWYFSKADSDDVLQEIRIAVWKAVRSYREDMSTTFRNFALNVCGRRQIITSMNTANRKKYALDNNAKSLDHTILTDDGEQTLSDFIVDRPNPFSSEIGHSVLDSILLRDEYAEIVVQLRKKLTPLEDDIFMASAGEDSYRDIAVVLDVKPKAVDNAKMRIRKKAAEVYQEYLIKTGQAIPEIEEDPEEI